MIFNMEYLYNIIIYISFILLIIIGLIIYAIMIFYINKPKYEGKILPFPSQIWYISKNHLSKLSSNVKKIFK